MVRNSCEQFWKASAAQNQTLAKRCDEIASIMGTWPLAAAICSAVIWVLGSSQLRFILRGEVRQRVPFTLYKNQVEIPMQAKANLTFARCKQNKLRLGLNEARVHNMLLSFLVSLRTEPRWKGQGQKDTTWIGFFVFPFAMDQVSPLVFGETLRCGERFSTYQNETHHVKAP